MNLKTFFTGRTIGFIVVLIVVAALYVLNTYIYNEKQDGGPVILANHKNIAYMIEGQRVQLVDGFAEMEAVPGSASKITTRYFGNELITDLDGDGRDDIVFLLTQERGGSGTFFYVVAALSRDGGYVGSDGYLLGDRIAPQTTNMSPNPRHRNVIVVNYADRAIGEPMTTRPSVGKSVYLKISPETMQWGVVVPDFAR